MDLDDMGQECRNLTLMSISCILYKLVLYGGAKFSDSKIGSIAGNLNHQVEWRGTPSRAAGLRAGKKSA